jgi:hypothetical protein
MLDRKNAATSLNSLSCASSLKRGHGMRLCFVFYRVQVRSETLQDSAYSIPHDGYISESEKW